MKVGIIQPSYLPWRGYLDFIDEVDLFIFLDDVQYSKQSWRNRNRIKTKSGLLWITVPVVVAGLGTLIRDIRIDNTKRWVKQHIGSLQANYAHAPYFREYAPELFDLLGSGFQTLSELNISLTRWLMQKLSIDTPLMKSSELMAQGKKTERLIDILAKVHADCYLSGPTAKGYIDEDMFREAGIRLEYKSYDYPSYPQLWGEFVGNVTVLDLLFNTGPESRYYMKSLAPNEVSVP